MGKFRNLAGQQFGRLTVTGRVGDAGSRWHCVCSCVGKTEKTVAGGNLTSGAVLSCGCLRNERVREARMTHGMTTSSSELKYLYDAYNNAKARCSDNPNYRDYHHYYGRGIRFEFDSVEQWTNKLGPRPDKNHTVDHIDNDGHYRPGNVRWAPKLVQRLNQRPKTNSTSFTGVSVMPNCRFRASFMVAGKRHHLGCFDTAEDAARAYDQAVQEHVGSEAHLNFTAKKPSASVRFAVGDKHAIAANES